MPFDERLTADSDQSKINRKRYIACDLFLRIQTERIQKMKKIKYKTGRLLVQLGNGVAWFRNYKLQDMDLTSSQSEVIRYILKHRDMALTAGDLMAKLNLSQSTVAGILKRLEKKELLQRQTDKTDARKSRLILTDAGLEVENRLKQVGAQTEEILLKGMTEQEQAEFNRLLKLALENMNHYKAEAAGRKGEQEAEL